MTLSTGSGQNIGKPSIVLSWLFGSMQGGDDVQSWPRSHRRKRRRAIMTFSTHTTMTARGTDKTFAVAGPAGLLVDLWLGSGGSQTSDSVWSALHGDQGNSTAA